MSTASHPAVLDPEKEQLRRDLTSAHVRTRTLIRQLTRAIEAPTVVAVRPGPDRECDEIVYLSNGVRLEHRWQGEAGWQWVETHIPSTPAAIVAAALGTETLPSAAFPGEMAVIAYATPRDEEARR